MSNDFVARTLAAQAHAMRREALARLLAAEIMGLSNDPLGQSLPIECWSQMTPMADAAMLLSTHTEASKQDVASRGQTLRKLG
jgi:hypothetical protein